LRTLITNITDNTLLLNSAAEQSSEKIAQVTDSLALQKETIEQVSEIKKPEIVEKLSKLFLT